MKLLIFGGTGMLGHKLAQVLAADHETAVAVRGDASRWPSAIRAARVFGNADVRDHAAVASMLDEWKPEAVLNAAGVVKQILGDQDPLDTVAINALYPNMLALLCETRGIRLVHYSTDCVFTGKADGQRGPEGYRETDPADSRDLYGMSKLLGEPRARTTLVLRTSIIGRELRGYTSLMEWFLSQGAGPVKGFTQAFFTGLTTLELSRVTAMLLRDFPDMTGLWHVSAPAIAKFDLLRLAGRIFDRPTVIEPKEDFYCDRRLDGSPFAQATGWRCPEWPELLQSMRDDTFEYGRGI
jgi:dTDP-4-dehydrorhamnose reductase